jgi:hypothetical protein
MMGAVEDLLSIYWPDGLMRGHLTRVVPARFGPTAGFEPAALLLGARSRSALCLFLKLLRGAERIPSVIRFRSLAEIWFPAAEAV